MFTYALKRLLESIPVFLAIATLTFFLIRLAPGGPFSGERELSPLVLEQLEAHYGMDRPILEQYGRFLWGLVQGDLGPSYAYPGWSVNELIREKIPVSLELGFYGLVIALVLGLSAGLIAAWRPHGWLDHSVMSLAMTGICLPTFVLGPLLLLVFALHLGWFNVSGWWLPGDRVLPSLTLGIYYAAFIARLSRGSLLEVRHQDFLRTARAKGLPEWRVMLVHSLRVGILPVVSCLGPAVAGLISGSFVVETVFNIPGLGRFFVNAAFNRDYTLVMGTVLFYSFLIIALNLVADLLLAALNPKLRHTLGGRS
jgi:oligopeptide transport system permease protein